ncbi:probable CTD kinase subunit alpha homolog [Dendronephthya gigantea]|uniref:probable CTD kinase subunit alpha homolog n=1 Tax=Dendronephthya gigantea TaxID=151771 RepID=UPI00106AF0BD|nr:probable CTD kinase subunit alpha homolog [Dendronephthya gigantea]
MERKNKSNNAHHKRSLGNRRENTRRRREIKRKLRKLAKDEGSKQTNNISNDTIGTGLANEVRHTSGENPTHLENIKKLEEENSRLHKHAVYFHYRWKKSQEETKTKCQPKLIELDRKHLHVDGKVGEGTFGNCFLAKYGSLKVAVKEIKSESLNEKITREAEILHSLRHPNLPLLLGVCFQKSPFLIITTYHSVETEDALLSTTMCTALSENIVSSDLRPHWLAILHDLSMAICYIHEKNIIHNDIKTNNVVIEKHGKCFTAVLIDFGKATAANNGKSYPEFGEKEREKYERKYPYLAPELKSGGGKQTVRTDVYSFGYLMKVVSHSLENRELSSLYHSCKNISELNRPNMHEIENSLEKLKLSR